MNKILDHFWRVWSRDYLMELRDIQRKSKNIKGLTDIEIGDVVLIEEDMTKRSQWRIGRVDEIIISKDGSICGAGLVTNTELGKGRLKRPLNKLYPFESNNNELNNEIDLNEEENDEPAFRFVKDNINITSHP